MTHHKISWGADLVSQIPRLMVEKHVNRWHYQIHPLVSAARGNVLRYICSPRLGLDDNISALRGTPIYSIEPYCM